MTIFCFRLHFTSSDPNSLQRAQVRTSMTVTKRLDHKTVLITHSKRKHDTVCPSHLSGWPLQGSWLLTLSKHLDFKKNNRSSTALFTVRRELCLCLCQQL